MPDLRDSDGWQTGVVFAVDDSPQDLWLIAEILNAAGHEVAQFRDGPSVLAAMRERLPDIVVVDAQMPGMTGYELCRSLHDAAGTRDLPVLFISGMADLESRLHAFRSGAVDYVVKPFQMEELQARVRVHVALNQARLRLATKQAELRESIARQKELAASRRSLIAMIVHDLRAPLLSIHGRLQLFARGHWGEITPPQRMQIQSALAAADTMAALISDVLDVEWLDVGELRLELGSHDLADVAGKVVETMRGIRGLERTELIARPSRIVGDRRLLGRVFANLLLNIADHAPESAAPTVRIGIEGDQARVEVEDHGSGLEPEKLARLRTALNSGKDGAQAQGGDSRSRAIGLGLMFCRAAVTAHGGSIDVGSREGRGTTFVFRLPVAGPALQLAPQPTPQGDLGPVDAEASGAGTPPEVKRTAGTGGTSSPDRPHS